MSNNKIYWRGIEELENDPGFLKEREQEFPSEIPTEEFLGDEKLAATSTNRRDFLKFLGFSVTAATLAACETPVKKAIPYVIKPESITPGVPNYYATTYFDGHDFASVMVKTREGRPIRVNGNKLCHLTYGSTGARIQGSVIGLYDGKRARGAMSGGQPVTWGEMDSNISKKLQEIQDKGGKTVLLTGTVISPTTNDIIRRVKEKYTSIEHVQYDAVSYSAIREANRQSLGKAIIPTYQFDKAAAIVSFGADFLNGWLLSNAYEKQYADARNLKNEHPTRHFQFEALLSMAGANADYRTQVKQSAIGAALVELYNYIASKAGKSSVSSGATLDASVTDAIRKAGDYLWSHKSHGLVVCGLNDVNAQLITNAINEALGNYGHTILTDRPMHLYQGNDARVQTLIEEVNGKKINGLIMMGVNPSYTLPVNAEAFNKAIEALELSVYTGDRVEETAAQYLAPDHHYLEAWGDYEPVAGHYTLQQPTIRPLFDTRAAQESLLVWTGLAMRGDRNSLVYRDEIRNYWSTQLFNKQSTYLIFDDFWNYSLHDGVFDTGHENTGVSHSEDAVSEEAAPAEGTATVSLSLDSAAKALGALVSASKGTEVVLYEKVGIGLGGHAANPMLQEFPDPISRVTWDNYVTMSPADMTANGYNQKMGQNQMADVVKVTVGNYAVELPVVCIPGQKDGVIGIALGYGRKFGRTVEEVVGKNAFPFISYSNSYFQAHNWNATVEGTGATYQIAGTQTHHTMMGRAIIKETSLSEYLGDHASGNPPVTMHTNLKEMMEEGEHAAPVSKIDYWKDFKMVNHRWGLSIDLNSCTGCGACVVACHVENNVAVVGKDEVRRSRDMHWLRIDRYYTSDADPSYRYEHGIYNLDQAAKMEIPSQSPRVAFQPIMCQHCNHAPCETVCPVLATTHSTEGLNQMTYNRCVGTRYCANNCPYKVRRFNWFQYANNDKFDYYMNDDLGKMVLNPDVTVRARGVMEKCSMCVQRIQHGKLEAKKANRGVIDQEIQTACSEACPTNAIVFGDYNDSESLVAKWSKDQRSYYLLEEVGVKPNVIYQTKIRNVDEKYGHHTEHAEHHEEGGHGENHEEHGSHKEEEHTSAH